MFDFAVFITWAMNVLKVFIIQNVFKSIYNSECIRSIYNSECGFEPL